MTTDTDTTPLSTDLLYGMQKIAEYLGVKRSIAYHLAATGRIPTFKIGKIVCARRSKVIAVLDQLEAERDDKKTPP